MKSHEQLSLFDEIDPVSTVLCDPRSSQSTLSCDDAEEAWSGDIIIYTDGACSGNPGPGGCAAIVKRGKRLTELSQGFKRTTNNRMEMMSLIMALETIDHPAGVTIHSDSKYLINAFDKKWIVNWKRCGWQTKARKAVKNIDLWKRLDGLLAVHEPTFVWVKGHSGHPQNERCDKLATSSAKGKELLVDTFFEKQHPILPVAGGTEHRFS